MVKILEHDELEEATTTTRLIWARRNEFTHGKEFKHPTFLLKNEVYNLNQDAATKNADGRIGIGVIVRDFKGQMLEASFSDKSKTREIQIKDELQVMNKGTRSFGEYSQAFKTLCDQLHAMGRPVDDTDKVHWFLRYLGPDFSSFPTTMMSQTPLPIFKDLVPKDQSHDLFVKSLESQARQLTAFIAQRRSRHSSRGA
ncbi:uncharacterized protein LOC118344799 [Juglans regia]|uniref:Uncharacterized protein LOC118344799 n=1 Tax=Juglans regia TaxID=51240 RepID=A0A6P9EGY0_JUGRE|nr:uncharacterized protein LOC118344799 [Juglans regia]